MTPGLLLAIVVVNALLYGLILLVLWASGVPLS